MVGLLGGKPLRHMKRASRGRQPVSLSLSGGRAPNRHKADYNSSQSREHFAAASAQFKAIFKEALFEDSTDVKELLQSHGIFFSRSDHDKIPQSRDDHDKIHVIQLPICGC